MMIQPLKCFQLYLACKTHFTSEKYDAVKSGARIRNSDQSHFENRPDHKLFHVLSKRFETAKDCASFFVANFAYGNDYPLNDFEKSERYYVRWEKTRQSLTQTFKNDVKILENELERMTYDELIGLNSPQPHLFLMMLNGKITPETIVILNAFENFIPEWYKNAPFWKPQFLRLKKMNSFIKFDKEKFKLIADELKCCHA